MKQWKIIPSLGENYFASSDGIIARNTKFGMRPLKGSLNQSGYLRVQINKKDLFVHKLVLEAFLGRQDKNGNHLNGVKADNRIENLEYCSSRENTTHAIGKKYTGVYPCTGEPNIFRACIKLDGKNYQLGRYDNQDDAHRAYLNVLKFMGLENKYALAKGE